MAWDFTVASTANITGRMLHIRDDAFAQLGDTNLADGIPQGTAPSFTVDAARSTLNYGIPYNAADPPGPAGNHSRGVQNIRTVAGPELQVPERASSGGLAAECTGSGSSAAKPVGTSPARTAGRSPRLIGRFTFICSAR